MWRVPRLRTTDPASAYQGRFVAFRDVDAHPRPARQGGPRIVIGGHSPAAFRRAVTRGHGWFGNGTLDDLPRHLAGPRRDASEVERPERLGKLAISYLPIDPVVVEPRSAQRYADLGTDRLVLYPLPLEDPSCVARFLEQHAGLPH